LAEHVKTHVYQPGDIVIKEGDHADIVYILIHGQVNIVKHGEVITTLSDGQVMGEMGLLSAARLGKRSATVVAKEVCDCRAVRQDTLLYMLKHFPADKEVLMAEIKRREFEQTNMVPPEKDEAFRKPVVHVGRAPSSSRARTPKDIYCHL